MRHQMRILQGLKLAAVLAVALSMGACANKNGMGGADGAMAGAATPGSQQDFVVNVGDRVFFESDQTDLTPQAVATLEKRSGGCRPTIATLSPLKATPTSAAPANTTSRWAHGARSRCVRSSLRVALPRSGCGRSPTARNGRSRSVTTSRAGRKTAGPSPS